VLRKGGHDDVEHLGDIHLPTDMPPQATFTPDSPFGVEEGPTQTNPDDSTPPPIKHTHPTVTINEATNLSPVSEERTPAGSTSTRGSALKNPSPTPSPDGVPHAPQEPRWSEFTLKGLEQGSNYIIDRSQKIYIAHDDNKQEQ
jgi:hypothetical protein